MHALSSNNDNTNNTFYAPFLWQLLKDVHQQNEVTNKNKQNP